MSSAIRRANRRQDMSLEAGADKHGRVVWICKIRNTKGLTNVVVGRVGDIHTLNFNLTLKSTGALIQNW
jgi:hypothetical protein